MTIREEIKCDCCEIINYPRIVCEEKKSKITFLNPNKIEIQKITVDGCQITDHNKPKCDYLLIHNETEKEYYIELKGHDIKRGLEQIEATIPRLSKSPEKQDKICFIISVRCPKVDTEIQNISKRLRNKYAAKVIIKNTPFEHLF